MGAVLLADSVYNFTSMAADPAVNVGTTVGEDAYLGVVSNDGEIDSRMAMSRLPSQE